MYLFHVYSFAETVNWEGKSFVYFTSNVIFFGAILLSRYKKLSRRHDVR